MTVNTRKLARNTGILMVSQVISWSMGIFIALIIPRYLGPENFGKINLAGSLWVIVGIIAVFGMDTLLTKTIARTPEDLKRLFSQTIYARLLLFLVGSFGLFIYVSIAGYDRDVVILILIAGIHTLTGLFNSAISASIQGMERMDLLAYTDIISKILSTILIAVSVILGAGVYFVQFILGIGITINFVLLSIIFVKIYPFKINVKVQPAQVKWLMSGGFAFFLLYIFITLYHQIDVITLSWLVDPQGVGIYSAADRLVGTLMFIPTSFMLVFFPTFSRLHLEGPETLRKIFFRAVNMMTLLGVAVGFGIFAVSSQIVGLIYGSEYVQSTPILSIRGIALAFTYLNIMMGMFLMSIDRQKVWVAVMGVATLATIPLDLIFVPLMQTLFGNGAMGGAIASVITELGMVVAAIILIPSGILGLANLWYALRAVIAGAGMVLSVWLLGNEILPLQIAIGMASFGLLAFVLRLISPEEINLVKSGMNRFLSKFHRKPAAPVNLPGENIPE
jgi:O-antigen/teichoic acid export membrane protein